MTNNIKFMLNYSPIRLLRLALKWLMRLTVTVSAVVALPIAIAVIVLRYWLLPDIEQYHDKITASLSAAIGNQVTIAKIEGDWQGFLPHLSFTDVRILDEQRQTALALQRIEGSVSWMSLFSAELRLASLEIDRPELLIRRDAQGKYFIGNLLVSKHGDNNNLSDWLLHQSNMLMRNALIVWVDELREAPPLVLQQVNLRVDNLFSQHRFTLRAIPPGELSTPLDVRGEFHGQSFDNVGSWYGQIFTQLDYTDVTAWRPWLDLPGEFSRGRGALRGWLGMKDGKLAQITADLDLRDVVTKLGADVPEMVLPELRGRASWREVAGGFEISTKHLAMRMQNGIAFQPTDFYFRLVTANQQQPASGQIRANLLQLENLSSLTKYFPMEADLRASLDAYAPKGTVSSLDAQWQGSPKKLDHCKIKGHFENISVNQVGKMPGFSGLTVDVDGNEVEGRLSINARGLAVDAPGVMREPLSFATLTGQADWQRERGELAIAVDNIALANDDLAGNLHGSYRTKADTLGLLDLTASLKRGDIRRAARYTPLIALNRAGNDWLNGALLAGHTEDFRIRIKGNLSDFPLDGSKNALFEIGGHARDVVLEFDKHWPRIENITGELSIHGNRLEVKSSSANLLRARLNNVTVSLPDMLSRDLALEIKGEANGASNALLEFVQKSPVRGYIDGFTDGIKASGEAHLNLSLRVPLMGVQPVKVSGTVTVQNNNIDMGQAVPLLRNTRGALSFTESGMRADGVLAEILGGTARINVQTSDGGVHATLKGRSNVDILHLDEPNPLLNYLHGSTAWDADISVVKKSAQIIINSSLQGVSSSLPQPFSKRADEVLPLHVEIKNIAAGQGLVSAQLGNLINAQLESGDENGITVIRRGTVNFGAQLQKTKTLESKRLRKLSRGKDGVWLVGSLPALSIQGWEGMASGAKNAGAVISGESGETSAPAFPIAGVNLHIEKLTGYGQSINALHIEAVRRDDGLAAQLSSGAINGEVVWDPRGYESGTLFSAHLTNLQWSGDDLAEPAKPAQSDNIGYNIMSPPSQIHPGSLPALDISIENLQYKGKQIGHFELTGHPEGQDWRLRRMSFTNPDGSLVGDGVWRDAAGKQQTQVNLELNISDAGRILARSGYPNTVKGGSGKLAANLSWLGAPDEFSFATLNGTLKLDTSKGQFIKMKSGAGKVLSVLSLQDLPKHIALGFADVFSEGFQFDNIIGDATITNGVMETQEFHIYGSAAKVALKGNIDLNRETQNLSVKVFPAIGDSVSLLAIFAINPAAGIAGLIADKLLGNPLDKLASFEYNISGTWSDPKVAKAGETPPKTK